ncbi:uncharacterized protein [Saccopteryx bilineata]|uniref:uncharacterized protein isoform X6 n=1 Tax=Saccopteryx bilineata TaxID=59482 RepID=UPI00338E861F
MNSQSILNYEASQCTRCVPNTLLHASPAHTAFGKPMTQNFSEPMMERVQYEYKHRSRAKRRRKGGTREALSSRTRNSTAQTPGLGKTI